MADKVVGSSVEDEVKIVDLARGRAPKLPAWLVRRAARIVAENREVLDLEELADLAIALMQEADARLATEGVRATR